MKKKKVCFFTGSQSLPGGTERACSDVANELNSSGYSITILSQYDGMRSSYKISKGIELKELSSVKKRGLVGYFKTSWGLFRYVLNERPDFLIAVESISFLFFVFVFFMPNRPVLINWEHFNSEIDLGVFSRRLARRLAVWFGDKVIVLSDKDKKLWEKRFNCSSERLARIYNLNPFPVEKFSVDAEEKDNSRYVLAAGRLTRQKGFDLLIQAWSRIPRFQRDGWTLRICGEGNDRQLLESLIDEAGLSLEVELVGHSSNIKSEYERANLFVLSSRFEGFGLVALEALSFGVPVISFDCPAGPSEIIEDGVDGLLVPNEDIDGLARALASFMKNKELRLSMAGAAKRARPQFSSEVIGSQWVSLLESFGRIS